MTDQIESLPIPPFYDDGRVDQIWHVPYQERMQQALAWAQQHQLAPSQEDDFKTALIIIDMQNSFCMPGFELFVGGASGMGAVEDSRRLCRFIYRNLGRISHIEATLDTHTAYQIFHPPFLVDAQGQFPHPLTLVSYDDVAQGRWRFNPAAAASLDITPEYGQAHLLHYTQELQARHKYDLTVWPFHVMLGSIGHALVPAVEEAVFFHTIARANQVHFEVKGSLPLTEHYSAIGPEVMDGPNGEPIAQRSQRFLKLLQTYDAVYIAGQAKSHCVAWTIDDLLGDIRQHDAELVEKVFLLEDCTSPVVIPGVVDYSQAADAAFERFAQAGMHVVQSTQALPSASHR